MDGSTTIKPEMLVSGSEEISPGDSKKVLSSANLALIDPKRAKRICANRESAARSKERKMWYIAELERKAQCLQTEATSLSAKLTLLHRDTSGLTVENSELKLQLQTMEQQIHLQDALDDALKEEIQHLKVLTGQALPNGGVNYTSFGGSQYYPNNQTMHTFNRTAASTAPHSFSEAAAESVSAASFTLTNVSATRTAAAITSKSERELKSKRNYAS